MLMIKYMHLLFESLPDLLCVHISYIENVNFLLITQNLLIIQNLDMNTEKPFHFWIIKIHSWIFCMYFRNISQTTIPSIKTM